MKDKIFVVMVYTLTFAAVTVGIIFLNQKYENIFKFDFRPARSNMKIDLKKPEYKLAVLQLQKELRKKILDSLKNSNSLKEFTKNIVDETPVLKDSIKTLKNKLKKLADARKQDSLYAANSLNDKSKKEYEEWLKKTASLYNSMEAVQAAKIIRKYSDNVARDIIYKLKKQKAAEILAMLGPEEATRITKVTK